jgi:oligopeptide transport system ATP-binding protein
VSDYLLEVQDLKTYFKTKAGYVHAVDGVSFALKPGEKLAIVGESGCGKSVTSLSIMRLIDQPAGQYAGGSIFFEDQDLLTLPEKTMRSIRGGQIGMIFQDPMTSLNPTMTVGAQIGEGLMLHKHLSRRKAHDRAIELLELVGIPAAAERARSYPHQFSGGMRQRVMIAIALASNPKLLIADEPTTALDVTVQAQIMELIGSVCAEFGTSLILITHDLGVVAGVADRVVVMYAGKVVEEASTEELFAHPRHPYTRGLLASVPRLNEERHGELRTIEGSPPDLVRPPTGCRFMPRCLFARGKCHTAPPLEPVGVGLAPTHREDSTHRKACWVDVTKPEEQAYAEWRQTALAHAKKTILAPADEQTQSLWTKQSESKGEAQ